MAREYVFIEYTFLFDPSESWQHLHQFESSLASLFSAQGYEAQILKTAGGQVGKRMMLLKPIPKISEVPDVKLSKTSSKIEKMRGEESKKEFRKKGRSLISEDIKKTKSKKLKYDKGMTMRNKIPGLRG